MKTGTLGVTNKGYLFLLPAFAVIAFVFVNPIVRMFLFSLERWSYLRPHGFNDLENYTALLANVHFYETLLNNVLIIVGVVPVVVVIALGFAQAIYSHIPGYRLYTFLFFIPVVFPDIVVAKIVTEILNKAGPVNALLSAVGLGFLGHDWLGDAGYSLMSIIVVLIWKNIGFALVLFLARLTTIEESIYEAAEMDGASAPQKYFYVTLPMLASTISLYIVLQVIGLMSFLFNYIQVMTAGGPGYSSTVLEYFIYLNIFQLQEIGKGSAAGVVLIIITAAIVFYYLGASGRAARKARREARG